MASKASRDAARAKAIESVARLFGKKSGLEKKTPEELAAQEALSNPIEGLEALYWPDPPPEVKGPSKKIYEGKSLCCLRPHNSVRRSAIFFIESPLFDPIILTTILVNCTTMA